MTTSFEGGYSNSNELWLTNNSKDFPGKKISLSHFDQDFSMLKVSSSSTTWHKHIHGWKKIGHTLSKSKLTWR